MQHQNGGACRTNVGDDEYKYFIFGLRDAETKQILDFQTNFLPLQRYVAEPPEACDGLLGVHLKGFFSTDFTEN